MTNPFIGQIQAFGFGIVPKGWLTCSGQLLGIAQNQPLFSLLGTTYGGDGRTTFALPDLRGAFALSPSSSLPIGAHAGETNHTLTTTEMPAHTHPMVGSTAPASSPAITPLGNFPAVTGASNFGTNTNLLLGPGSNNAGGGQPHSNMPPYLAMNFCIAIQGIFPTRS